MKPSELAHGGIIVVEFPQAHLDYTFTRENNIIWFGACISTNIWPSENNENVAETHPLIKLTLKQADIIYKKLDNI